MSGPQLKVKSVDISKRLVHEAWEKVQANGGAPGVDTVSIEQFADKERNNLYQPVEPHEFGELLPRAGASPVEIPKDHGAGVRTLGVPNTVDRIAPDRSSHAAGRKA